MNNVLWLPRAMFSAILLLGIGCGGKTHVVGSTADGGVDAKGGDSEGTTGLGGAGGIGGTMAKDAVVETGGNGGTGGAGTGGIGTGGATQMDGLDGAGGAARDVAADGEADAPGTGSGLDGGGARGSGGGPGSGGITGTGGGTGGGTTADSAEYTACEYLGDSTQERVYRIDRTGSVCTEITFVKGLAGCTFGLSNGNWCLAGASLSTDIANCAINRVFTGTIKAVLSATGTFSVNTASSPPVVDFDLTLQFPASPGLPQSVHAWASGCKVNCASTDCRE